MTPDPGIKAGDVEGRGSIYTNDGALVLLPGEVTIRVANAWDMHVWSPWRRVRPKVIFLGFNPEATSLLYITSVRVVLIRDIDPWREVAGEMTPLGIPTAVAKEAQLRHLKASGIRRFCDIRPSLFSVAKCTKSTRGGSRIGLRLKDGRGVQYAVTYWKTDGMDNETLNLLESRFLRRASRS